MKVEAIRTERFQLRESLLPFLERSIIDLPEYSVLAITSKIISLAQGRVVSMDQKTKKNLIHEEADAFLKTADDDPNEFILTIKENILIPSAGIDQSNGDQRYILYPIQIQETAFMIWEALRNKFNLKSFGLLITDSHSTPLRRGVIGIALGWCGFQSHYSYIGQPDLYDRPMQKTQMNLLDALAVSAVFVMGEGREQTPLALIQDIPHIQFLAHPPTQKEIDNIHIHPQQDLYSSLLNHVEWVWNNKNKK